MKTRIIWVILPVLIAAVSCSEDDDPTAEDGITKVIGENVYRILQGNDQTGVAGQLLPLDIKIRVTDLQGAPKFTSLQFETSDPGAEVIRNFYSGSDTVALQWKLGCNEKKQTLTIIDNICGIAKDGCVDVNIFEITAVADGTPMGWFETCQTLNIGYTRQILSNDEAITVIGNDRIYSIDDVVNGTWFTSGRPENVGYTGINVTSTGEMYYRAGSTCYVSLDQGQSWSIMTLPSGYGDFQMLFLKNGDLIYAREFREVHISSNKGSSWDLLVDVPEATANQASEVQSIAAKGQTVFIMVDNHNIIEVENDEIKIHEFAFNSWPVWADLSTNSAEVVDNHFLFNHDRTLYVLDLGSNRVIQNLDLYRHGRMIRSAGDVYVVNETNGYWKYENNAFRSKSFDLPRNIQNGSGISALTFHQGSPAFINSSGKLFYYIN